MPSGKSTTYDDRFFGEEIVADKILVGKAASPVNINDLHGVSPYCKAEAT